MLADNDIQLWCVRDALEDVDACLRLLSSEELQRLSRLRQRAMRQQFVMARAAVRAVLSKCFPEIAAQSWTFDRNPWGRPAVSNPQVRGRVSFNIAHTDDMIVIAVCRRGEVGVDVEHMARRVRAGALAQRYFSVAEAAALHALPLARQRQRFLELWTLKEAYIKACGKGLAIPLGSFSFALDAESPAVEFAPEPGDDAQRWQFWQLQVGEDHLVGLAVTGAPAGVSVHCRSLLNLQPGPDEPLQVIRHSGAAQ